ncbi:uncharacterized protein LOC141903347 [Tubulanus polymorphus]|uniref:uncharacterized protein LOC141903347 n=1 Tax=Tubulanus polymorphus TaxID=672921 RepID=UPI003DA537ED
MALNAIHSQETILPQRTDEIDDMLMQIMEKSMCPCSNCPLDEQGYILAVAVVPALVPRDAAPLDEEQKLRDLQRFASYLRKTSWKFGFCGNDGVIALSVSDGLVHTSVGPIIREKLTRQCLQNADELTREMVQSGNHTAGLLSLLDQFRTYITDGSPCIVGQNMLKHENWPLEAILGMIFGCLSFFVVCVVTLTRFCSGAGSSSGGGSRARYYKNYMEQQNRASLKAKDEQKSFQTLDGSVDKSKLQQDQETATMLAMMLENNEAEKASVIKLETKPSCSEIIPFPV